jgi:hypothetical protein
VVTAATERGLNKTNCRYPATPAIEVAIPHIYASVKLHVTVKTNRPLQIKTLRCTNTRDFRDVLEQAIYIKGFAS